MFFPVPVEVVGAPSRRVPPFANSVIIGMNVLLYALGVSWNWGVGRGTTLFTVLTYAFAHADVLHLLGNMWILWLFGNAVNARIGNRLYALTYFGIALALGCIAWLFSDGVLVGSSGAIYGVVAMATMLLAGTRVRVFYVALIPMTLFIGLIEKPRHWLEWLLRWDHFSFLTLFAIFFVPLLELWGLWRWSVAGHLNWTQLGHLAGFVLGIVAVLLLPLQVTLRRAAA